MRGDQTGPANGVRISWSHPSGLPIVSTEPLTEAERRQLRALRLNLRLLAETIDDCLDSGRVDRSLDGLQYVDGELLRQSGLVQEIATKLGTGR